MAWLEADGEYVVSGDGEMDKVILSKSIMS